MKKPCRPELTAEKLRETLRYDPETGLFFWRCNRQGGAKAGTIAGCFDAGGYVRVTCLGRTYPAHRLAWLYVTGMWPTNEVDHINGDRSDNRWANLRAAESSQNSMNRAVRRNCASGVKGLSQLPSGSWLGAIYKQGKCWKKESKDKDLVIQWLGQTRKSLHGEFASDGTR